MKTTHSRSLISELILACFFLSIFLLIENHASTEKEDKVNFSSSPTELETTSMDIKKNSVSLHQ